LRSPSLGARPDAVKISDISYAFAARNSLLAGNLTGNFQNPAQFAPFLLNARLDHLTYQYVRREFPVPRDNKEFLLRNREFVRRTFSLEGHWCPLVLGGAGGALGARCRIYLTY
jgi:hypothetical protein